MKIGRNGPSGSERVVAEGADGVWHDLTEAASGTDVTSLASMNRQRVGTFPVAELHERWGVPLARIGKIVCIGLNYGDHARESGAEIPAEPIIFMKAPDTVIGANDQVRIPPGSTKTDWEVELAVVVGSVARYLDSPRDAESVIAGYAISNDVSERAFQLERGGQWDKGKNCETFNPLGPWLVTADEVRNPQDLSLRLWVNGDLKQDGTTADMIFPVDYLVWYVSQFMTLYPGDIINTGTPAGVALGTANPRFLRPGDIVELELSGLGRQRQVCVST